VPGGVAVRRWRQGAVTSSDAKPTVDCL